MEPPAGVTVEGSRVPGRLSVYPRFQGEVQPVTDEQRAAKVRALVEERRGYQQRGQTDRVAAVDSELARLGAAATKPSARAEKRGEKP